VYADIEQLIFILVCNSEEKVSVSIKCKKKKKHLDILQEKYVLTAIVLLYNVSFFKVYA